MFAVYIEKISRAEAVCIEDLPKVANFCPKKRPEKELEACTTTLCARWTRTNDQRQFVVPLHLEWGPTMVYFSSTRRWTEMYIHYIIFRCFDPILPECAKHLKARKAFELTQNTEPMKYFSADHFLWFFFFTVEWHFFKTKTFPGNTPVGTKLVIVIADKAANSRGL